MDKTKSKQHDHRIGSQHVRPTIGLLGHGIPGEFDSVWIGATEVAQEWDVNVIYFEGGMLYSPHGFEAQANIICDLVDRKNVNGLMITGVVVHYVGTEAMKHLCDYYAPLPVVTEEVPVSGIPTVLIDFYQGMHDVMVHLNFACSRPLFSPY